MFHTIVLAWIHGHKYIWGNEKVNLTVKECAFSLRMPNMPWSLKDLSLLWPHSEDIGLIFWYTFMILINYTLSGQVSNYITPFIRKEIAPYRGCISHAQFFVLTTSINYQQMHINLTLLLFLYTTRIFQNSFTFASDSLSHSLSQCSTLGQLLLKLWK